MFGQSTNLPSPKPQPFNIDADQTSSNQQGVVVPYLMGEMLVPFHQIAPTYNLRSEKIEAQTGKDESSTVGHVWFGDIADILICCEEFHPADAVLAIVKDSQLVWEGEVDFDADPYEPITVDGYGPFRFWKGATNQSLAGDPVLTPIGPLPPGVNPRKTSTWPGGDRTQKLP